MNMNCFTRHNKNGQYHDLNQQIQNHPQALSPMSLRLPVSLFNEKGGKVETAWIAAALDPTSAATSSHCSGSVRANFGGKISPSFTDKATNALCSKT